MEAIAAVVEDARLKKILPERLNSMIVLLSAVSPHPLDALEGHASSLER